MTAAAYSRLIRLRHPGICELCRRQLVEGSDGWWSPGARTIVCVDCASRGPAAHTRPSHSDEVPASEPSYTTAGAAGHSAQQIHDQRESAREARIREKYPRLGGLIFALTDEPSTTKAWATGAEGERRIGRRLDEETNRGMVALHDRRIPGSRANIDHLVIGPAGVFVIDTKRYRGTVEQRATGPWLRPGPPRLFVANRDRTALVEGMISQVAAVSSAASRHFVDDIVPVIPILCFVDAQWGLFAKPFTVSDVHVVWPTALIQLVTQPGPFSPQHCTDLAHQLATQLPPA